VLVWKKRKKEEGRRAKERGMKRKDWGECAAFEMRFTFLLWGKGERDDFFDVAHF